MDDELDRFIRERKERVARDKAGLEQDPPYMEVTYKPRRTLGSTVKENIPPKASAQGKEEEGSSMGLPLGIEYERKKQKLQQELRMDYRHYMAQKKQFSEAAPLTHLENWSSVKRTASRRDAATLTEDNGELPGAAVQAEPKNRLEVDSSHCSRLDEPAQLLDDRKLRDTAVQAGCDVRRSSRTDGRERREIHISAKAGRRSRTLAKNEDAEFATGLIIGAVDTEAASQRRRERYRQELQEQIAEQHRNRKREKDLELKVAATGANDPEKPPDRIRQFGLHRRKGPVVELPDSGGGLATPPRSQEANNDKAASSDSGIPPHELPRVAFQSPLLDYYSSLGGATLLPSSRPPAGGRPATIEPHSIPRAPMFHPHPSLREAYRSQYGDPYQYYGTQTLLDPNMAYYGQLPVPAAAPPMMCWNSPPGDAVPHQFGLHSPLSHLNGSSFPEPPVHPSRKTADESQFKDFPSERTGTTREGILGYREALKQQIQEQQERRLRERKEAECLEAQLEADMKSHQPWGRGGGGAPLRDSTGNLIADLNRMHKLNEEAYSNPKQWQRRGTLAAHRASEGPEPNERVSGFALVHTPQFARGSVLTEAPPQQKLQEQDQYKSFLKQQIEDKMRRKAEEREQIRLEEEKEERRLQEQRARIQKEYEEEQEKKKQKEMEQKAKNEELILLAEQRKREAERKKKEVEEKENATLRKRLEEERRARVEEVRREPSPPIPTLQRKLGPPRCSPGPPTADGQPSPTPPSERSVSGLQSPPVPARRNQLRAAGHQHDVFSGLSALRRQLQSEQKRLEDRMQQQQEGDWEEPDSPLSDRLRDRPPVDVFDMARLRLQVPVRRPNSRKLEPRNLSRIHDSLQLKNSGDGQLKLGFSEAAKQEEVGLTTRRGRYNRDLHQQFGSQRPDSEDDYLDLSPPRQRRDDLGNGPRGSARGSLLQSESAFIDPLAEAFPVPRTPDVERTPVLSARQRRRLTRPTQQPQDWEQQQHHDRSDGPGHAAWLGARPVCDWRNQNGTGRLMDFIGPDAAGPGHLSDDSPPLRFSPPSLNRLSSAESAATDRWLRPGTSDTLKGPGRPSKRERVAT